MTPPVKLNDILEATKMSGEEVHHYLDTRTGEIVMVSREELIQRPHQVLANLSSKASASLM